MWRLLPSRATQGLKTVVRAFHRTKHKLTSRQTENSQYHFSGKPWHILIQFIYKQGQRIFKNKSIISHGIWKTKLCQYGTGVWFRNTASMWNTGRLPWEGTRVQSLHSFHISGQPGFPSASGIRSGNQPDAVVKLPSPPCSDMG